MKNIKSFDNILKSSITINYRINDIIKLKDDYDDIDVPKDTIFKVTTIGITDTYITSMDSSIGGFFKVPKNALEFVSNSYKKNSDIELFEAWFNSIDINPNSKDKYVIWNRGCKYDPYKWNIDPTRTYQVLYYNKGHITIKGTTTNIQLPHTCWHMSNY